MWRMPESMNHGEEEVRQGREINQSGLLKLANQPDSASGFALAFQGDFEIALAQELGKLFSPFDQEKTLFGPEVIECEGIKLALRVDTIQVDVEEVGAWPAILVNQGKGRAGHFIFRGCPEARGNSLHQRGFSGAQIPAQQH
jgi:hypothetical protein